ncbi:MAG: 50S ribosomal protein L18 [Candidatus Omnitrophica bacterium]|nr:50S ribosomal protein L18 [Candidatus Omnitrophota bacterium]MDD5653003.1 50S ribosomal protein L18 [Candidatus Omnitrophota bacterium]
MKNHKEQLRLKRHKRILMKIFGTAERPRLVIRRSLQNFHAQLIDDTKRKSIISLSTLDKQVKAKAPSGGNNKAAVALGEVLALRLKEKGVTQVIFDRAGYLYHGRVKSFADALRKGGLKF